MGLAFPRLLVCGTLVIALHNAEEALTMPSWMQRRLPEVAGRLGLGEVRPPAPGRVYAGLVAVTVVPALCLLAAARSRPRSPAVHAALAVIGVFLWNALVPHLALSALLGEYTPGVVTAGLLTLPYGVLAYRRALAEGYAGRLPALGMLAASAILYPVGMLALWRPFAAGGSTAALLACLACGAAGTDASAPSGGGQAAVLFIGNSLTAANDLPGRARRIASAAGMEIDTGAVTVGGASLLDHWDAGRAREMIRSRRWSVVVLQQGPSTLPESRQELTRLAGQFGEEIRRAGARPALLMVWPLPGQTAEAVSASYRAAAEATGSLLIPAGDAWVRARAADPGVELTGPDGFHPSPLGTELAAAAVVCTLYPAVRPAPVLPLEPAERDLVTRSACEPGGP